MQPSSRNEIINKRIREKILLNFLQFTNYKYYRNLTAELVRRAEKSGYVALVLTVDAPYFGIRRADARNKFTLPPHLRLSRIKSSYKFSTIYMISNKKFKKYNKT